MTDLVCVIKRIRHMIESVKITTIIFTNYSAYFFIVKQITLNSENIDKLNFRLVRISVYHSQFNIDLRYKIDKFNVIFDALFRLSFNNSIRDSVTINTLNMNNYHIVIENISTFNYAFQNSLTLMISKCKIRIIQKYFEEKSWSKIIKMLKSLKEKTSTKKNENDELFKRELILNCIEN